MERRIAVLREGAGGACEFFYPIENGLEDHHSNYFHGAKYGNGGFTGERCMTHRAGPYAGHPVFFRTDDHEERLERSVAAYEFLELPCTKTQRIEARLTLAAMNQGDNYLSCIFGTEGGTGVRPPKGRWPLVMMNTSDMDPETKPYLPEDAMRHGLRLRICEPDYTRRKPGPAARAKISPNYFESNVAAVRAEQAGCHNAILLDYTGSRVSELTVSNFVAIDQDGRYLTPFADSGPLPGITLKTVAQIVTDGPDELRGQFLEVPFPLGLLPKMRGAFATGTAVGIVRIQSIIDWNGRPIWTLRDKDAEDRILKLNRFYWDCLRGLHHGYHDEWYLPVPSEYLDRYRDNHQLHHA